MNETIAEKSDAQPNLRIRKGSATTARLFAVAIAVAGVLWFGVLRWLPTRTAPPFAELTAIRGRVVVDRCFFGGSNPVNACYRLEIDGKRAAPFVSKELVDRKLGRRIDIAASPTGVMWIDPAVVQTDPRSSVYQLAIEGVVVPDMSYDEVVGRIRALDILGRTLDLALGSLVGLLAIAASITFFKSRRLI